jgi:putative multicomponent Na+:H+ antiporter subunit B
VEEIMNDSYIYVLVALLPLAACMLVFQVNPYHTLMLRGVLGAIAALVYAILGAGDVALTEALVGTLLAVTLYAVTVRSSLVLRLGAIAPEGDSLPDGKAEGDFKQLIDDLRTIFRKHHMRLEIVPYTNPQALHRALMEKEVHAICARQNQLENNLQELTVPGGVTQPYHTATRVRRLYEIVQAELSSPGTLVTYVNTPEVEEKHS